MAKHLCPTIHVGLSDDRRKDLNFQHDDPIRFLWPSSSCAGVNGGIMRRQHKNRVNPTHDVQGRVRPFVETGIWNQSAPMLPWSPEPRRRSMTESSQEHSLALWHHPAAATEHCQAGYSINCTFFKSFSEVIKDQMGLNCQRHTSWKIWLVRGVACV